MRARPWAARSCCPSQYCPSPDCCCGSATRPARHGGNGRRRRRDLHQPRPAVRDRRRRRPGAREPRRRGTGGGGRVPRRHQRRGSAAGRARRRARGRGRREPGRAGRGVEGQGAGQAQRADGHHFRLARRHALQPLQRHPVAELSRLLRRAALRADRFGLAPAAGGDGVRLQLAGAGRRHGPLQPRRARSGSAGCSLRRAQPHPDHHRPAPHHQQHRLVHRSAITAASPAI
jgi:hypothetical protein